MRIRQLPVHFSPSDGSVRGVARAIREAIEQGRLVPRAPLPSTRDLADQLGVSRNTVLGAIALLVDNELLETRPGVGTYVNQQTRLRSHKRGPPGVHEFALTAWAKRLPRGPFSLMNSSAFIDFKPGLPDLRTIPFDEWRRSASRKLKTLRSDLGNYGSPQGNSDLRREIALYVARSRGVICMADDIIVTSGAQQAFDLIGRLLIGHDAEVAFESPGYPIAAQVFATGGAVLRGVAVDQEGLDPAQIPAGCSMAYVTPSHQYPLGVTMSDARRRALLAWAERTGAFIVEDDYDSEFVYSRQALPALRASDESGRVIYVGTFSKTLMPGIRLGFLIVPPVLRELFMAARWLTDRHSDNISQAVLAEFMESGQFGRHVTRMRAMYADRHAHLVAFRAPLSALGHTLLPSSAGLHVCLLLGRDLDEAAVMEEGRRAQIGLYGLRAASFATGRQPGLVLGFGNLAAQSIKQGIQQLLALLGSARR